VNEYEREQQKAAETFSESVRRAYEFTRGQLAAAGGGLVVHLRGGASFDSDSFTAQQSATLTKLLDTAWASHGEGAFGWTYVIFMLASLFKGHPDYEPPWDMETPDAR
jgi:hypothetical protein